MITVNITNSTISNFSTAIALIAPLFIIAILVDSSRDAQRIGPYSPKKASDEVSVRQSRRTLLAIAVGITLEVISLLTILTIPIDSEEVLPLNYSSTAFQGLGLLVLLYLVFIPHLELHISNIRSDPGTARWTLIVGWLLDACVISAALVQRFIGLATANFIAAYVLLGLGLMLTGSMLTLTVSVIRRSNADKRLAKNQDTAHMETGGDKL